jgi:long-chain fatty acid transport protein
MTHKTITLRTAIPFAILLITSLEQAALGLGFRLPNQDAEAIARGNAFAATADNPAAIYYNPAGISQLEGHNLLIGMYGISVESKYHTPWKQGLDGVYRDHADTVGKIAVLPQLYYSYTPPESSFSFGVGMYAPFGLGTDWEADSPIRTLATQTQLQYVRLAPVASWELLPGLSVAAGPTINYSTLVAKRGIALPGDEFSLDGEAWAFGFTAGLLWKFHPQWSFGFSYQSATSMNYDGDAVLYPYEPMTSAHTEIDFPDWYVFGIAFHPTDKWDVEFDLDYTDWDRLSVASVHRSKGPDLYLPFNYSSGFMYKFGTSYRFDNGFKVSGGYFYTEQNANSEDFNPAVPDTELHTGSAGVSYDYKNKVRYSIGYQFITGDWREIKNNVSTSLLGTTADGEFRYIIHAINLSVGFRF